MLFPSSQAAVSVAGAPRAGIRIALLGTPDVSWRGEALTLARRQARALLFRVAASTQPVPRDQLCFLLWPDQPDTVARRNLSVLLDQLRRALPAPDILLKATDAVALNPQRAWADTAAFAQAPAALRAKQLDRLADLAALYRGPFLHGFALPGSAEFDEWAAVERQAWERRFLDTLSALVDAHTAQSAYAAAVDAAQRYLSVDPLAEEQHRNLMALYAAQGDRAAALRQYERAVVALERELGVDPLPETRAVYEAIRDGRGPLQAPRSPQRALEPPARVIGGVQPGAKSVAGALPAPSSPMVGRSDELATARNLLRSKARLLTLCGPGGSGKTRLALAVAAAARDDYADGVVWVPLAPLRDPALVADAVVQACGLQLATAADPADALRAHLHDKQLLLVVDNLEHLLPAAPLFADLLAAAPRLQLLVTSRSVLNLYGEHALPVLPLSLPDLDHLPALDDLAAQPALSLLLERARAHNHSVRLSAENAAEMAAICVRLDGLPLAIELAAARLKLLSPRELLKRLDHRLALLEGGPRDLPERQQTLRATIAWSYQLLSDTEAQLLNRLAVFAGGWTLGAAEAVCRATGATDDTLDGLQALLEAHLIVRQDTPDGEPRFSMLETIREYALEQLEYYGLAQAATRAHALLYLEQATQAAKDLTGPRQAHLLAQLDAEHSNFKVALETLYAGGDLENGLRLAGALDRFWRSRGYLYEGLHWIERLYAAQRVGDANTVPVAVITRALDAACTLAYYQSDMLVTRSLVETNIALLRDGQHTRELALALIKLVRTCFALDDVTAAMSASSEAMALAASLADPEVNAELSRSLADQAVRRGDMAYARACYEGSLVFWRSRGDLLRQIADLYNLANLALTLDDVAAAETYATEVLTLSGSLASRSGRALALYTLGEIARYRRDLARAERYYRECLLLFRAVGRRDMVACSLQNLGVVALDRGNIAEARQLVKDALHRFQEQGFAGALAHAIEAFGRIAAVTGRPLAAARLWGAAEAQFERSMRKPLPIDQVEHDRYEAQARAASAPLEFEAARNAGRRLSVEHVLAEAAAGDVETLLVAAA